MSRLVGLSGRAGAGKSTLAAQLELQGWKRYSFARPIKEALICMGIPPEYITGDKKQEVVPGLGKTGRYIMQTLGTEWGRELINPSIWIYMAETKIKAMLDAGYNVVVDDVRFANEAIVILNHSGILYEVIRPGQDKLGGNHVSESGHGQPCNEIINDGEPSQLIKQLI